jgi:hypothetical protein
MFRTLLVLMACMFVLCLAPCGSDDLWENVKAAGREFKVIGSTPEQSQSGVARDASITVFCNEDILAASVSNGISSLTLSDGSGSFPGTLTRLADGRSLSFTPSNLMPQSGEMRFVLNIGLHNKFGRPLAGNFELVFRTENPFTLTGGMPYPDGTTTDWGIEEPLGLHFSNPLSSSINYADYIAVSNLGAATAVGITVTRDSEDSHRLIVRPNAPWGRGTTNEVTVSQDLPDGNGRPLTNTAVISYRFIVGQYPVIRWSNPWDGSAYAYPWMNIEIEFSDPMSTAAGTAAMPEPAGYSVTASWPDGTRRLRLTPSPPFAYLPVGSTSSNTVSLMDFISEDGQPLHNTNYSQIRFRQAWIWDEPYLWNHDQNPADTTGVTAIRAASSANEVFLAVKSGSQLDLWRLPDQDRKWSRIFQQTLAAADPFDIAWDGGSLLLAVASGGNLVLRSPAGAYTHPAVSNVQAVRIIHDTNGRPVVTAVVHDLLATRNIIRILRREEGVWVALPDHDTLGRTIDSVFPWIHPDGSLMLAGQDKSIISGAYAPYLVRYTGSGWASQGFLSGTSATLYGYRFAVSGSTVCLAETMPGGVQSYRMDGNSWTPLGAVLPYNDAALAPFGGTIQIAGGMAGSAESRRLDGIVWKAGFAGAEYPTILNQSPSQIQLVASGQGLTFFAIGGSSQVVVRRHVTAP